MKRSISFWQVIGFGVTSLLGTLLHFLYAWLGESSFAAIFSAVNESTWEHMKIFFLPTFAFALIQSKLFKEYEDFWCVKLKGILLGLTLIPVIFYTYNGAIGKSPDWINISIFFISAGAVYFYETKMFENRSKNHCAPRFSLAILWIIAVLFVVFTFITPQLEIFRDPNTGAFGING
ncbi:MAG: hypothetical protein IJP09_00175 [Clostridia bacterium]|nr:hypothetical protein [Clostridia bacterium]